MTYIATSQTKIRRSAVWPLRGFLEQRHRLPFTNQRILASNNASEIVFYIEKMKALTRLSKTSFFWHAKSRKQINSYLNLKNCYSFSVILQ